MVGEDSSVVINLLANDSDVEDGAIDPATITLGNPSHGSLVNHGDGTVTYTPNANYHGNDSFTYTVRDSQNATSNTATVSLTINAVNDAPVATVTNAAVDEDSQVTVDVLTSATDADGDALTLQSVSNPANGTASIVGGDIVYTPNANFNGSDSLSYTISDGNGGEGTKTLNITVGAVNDAPIIATPLANQTATEAEAFNFTFSSASFSDIDGDVLTYSATLADGGVLPSWLSFDAQTRSFTGTPDTADVGALSIKVAASDGSVSVDDSFDITINAAPPPAANEPTAPTGAGVIVGTENNDTINTGSGSQIINALGDDDTIASGSGDDEVWGGDGNDSIRGGGGDDIIHGGDGDDLLTGNGGANTFVFASNNGQDTITDLRSDDTIILYNSPYASPQQALDAVAFSNGGATLDLGAGNHITFDNADDGDFTSSTFVIEGTSNPPPANNLPVATVTAATVDEDSQVTVDVLAGATDADNDIITLQSISTPANGTASIVNGDIVYTPNANFSGNDSLSYTISDGNGGTDSETLNITVNAVNDAPTATNTIADQNATEAQTFDFSFASNAFSDVDGDTLTYSATLADGSALPSWLSFNAQTRNFNGTPDAADVGTISVKVTASDGSLSVDDIFDISVDAAPPPNTAPAAGNDSGSVAEDGSVVIKPAFQRF